MVAFDAVAGKLMVIPVSCIVTMASVATCGGAGIEAGNLSRISSSVNIGCGSALMKDEHYTYMMLYLFGSLALGLIAVLSGHQLAKWV